MADAYVVRLGREELVYLLRAMGIKTIAGLPEPPLGNLNADQQGLAMAVADRSLRARGIVQAAIGSQRTLDPMMTTLLRHFSAPAVTVMLEIVGGDRAKTALFTAFTPTLAIEHNVSDPGVHQFLALGTTEDVVDAVRRHLPTLPDMPVSEVTATIPRQQLQLDSVSGAVPNFSTQVPPSIAQALKAPLLAIKLARWHGVPTTAAPTQTLTVVQGAAGLWQYSVDEEWLQILPINAAGAARVMEAFWQPALNLLPHAIQPATSR